MFRAGIHTQTGGPYFRAGTNTGNGWVTLLCSKVLWLVCWFIDLLIVPMVFHVPINRLGVHLKRAWSDDCVATCDCIDDQSLGRSCDTFPGSRACISNDLKVVEMSRDRTCDRSGDSFPGSCGQGVDLTTWLYFSLGAALGGLGLGFLWMHDVADSVLDRNWKYNIILNINMNGIYSSDGKPINCWSRTHVSLSAYHQYIFWSYLHLLTCHVGAPDSLSHSFHCPYQILFTLFNISIEFRWVKAVNSYTFQ